MSKLDKLFELYFGNCKHLPTAIKDEAKLKIKDLMLEIIGEDEPDLGHSRPTEVVPARNDLRAELRKKVEQL